MIIWFWFELLNLTVSRGIPQLPESQPFGSSRLGKWKWWWKRKAWRKSGGSPGEAQGKPRPRETPATCGSIDSTTKGGKLGKLSGNSSCLESHAKCPVFSHATITPHDTAISFCSCKDSTYVGHKPTFMIYDILFSCIYCTCLYTIQLVVYSGAPSLRRVKFKPNPWPVPVSP